MVAGDGKDGGLVGGWRARRHIASNGYGDTVSSRDLVEPAVPSVNGSLASRPDDRAPVGLELAVVRNER